MKKMSKNIEEYLKNISADRMEYFVKLRDTIITNLPKGFVEEISNGMIAYVVPFSIYPKGYHCNTKTPLPFVYIASQKNFISIYHMGIYANPELLKWFVEEYPKHCKVKLDMGKSCIRFKKPDQIPFELIGVLMQKITVKNWINMYETNFRK